MGGKGIDLVCNLNVQHCDVTYLPDTIMSSGRVKREIINASESPSRVRGGRNALLPDS
jgi:hypothetical protein